ncbi:MAG: hypothetical protein ACTSR8_11165 [Promethearchaeota archaeon]
MTIIKILRFIDKYPKCIVPNIRDSFGIAHSEPPSKEEKNLYKIISSLSAQGMIEKRKIKKREPGGAHFYLVLKDLGSKFLTQIGISQEKSSAQREDQFEKLEASIRLAIRTILSGKVSKPEMVELVGELSSAILKEIALIQN